MNKKYNPVNSMDNRIVKRAESILDNVIEKQAGLVSGAFIGAIPGVMIGGSIGETVGKIVHRKPTPEVASEKARYEKAEELNRKVMDEFKKRSNPLGVESFRVNPNADEFHNALLDEFSSDKYDNLTVRQVEGLASNKVHDYAKSIHKTASFKTTLIGAGVSSVPFGIAAGKMAYDTQKTKKKDPNYWRESTVEVDDHTKDLKDMMKGGTHHIPFLEEYHRGYAPSVMMKYDNPEWDEHEFAYSYGESVNNALRKKGINPRDLTWGDYKKLTRANIENIANGLDVDLSLINHKGENSMNKKALDIVNETFEKIAAPSRDEETRTRFGRDLLVPELKRTPASYVATMGGGLVGNAIARGKGFDLGADLMASGKVNKKALAAVVAGGVAGKATQNAINGAVRHRKLKKLNEQYGLPTTGADLRVNYGITPQLFSSVSDASIGQRILHPIKNSLSTPEAIVQAKRRKLENAQ